MEGTSVEAPKAPRWVGSRKGVPPGGGKGSGESGKSQTGRMDVVDTQRESQ